MKKVKKNARKKKGKTNFSIIIYSEGRKYYEKIFYGFGSINMQ